MPIPPAPKTFSLGPLSVDSDSIKVSIKDYPYGIHACHRWSYCRRVADAPGRLYLNIGRLGTIIIALSSDGKTQHWSRLGWTREWKRFVWHPSRDMMCWTQTDEGIKCSRLKNHHGEHSKRIWPKKTSKEDT